MQTKNTTALALSALGVVFGDIGTSPLYALRECFAGHHKLDLTADNIYGILSLITWSLILVISVKYVLFVMRADNGGEGGVLALMALLKKPLKKRPRALGATVIAGLFGAALLYGDGMITPAISVLSAVEGLKIATPGVTPYVMPLTVFVLGLLFYPQRHGTGKVARVFGPIILTWFLVMAALGVANIMENPHILGALSPHHAVRFFIENGKTALMALGAVVLVVTGGEALFADMGHFDRRSIKMGWFAVVLPSLLLNYLGQGSLLLHTPSAIENPFFYMAPDWAHLPLVGLATMSAIIASQALISGAFSLTRQGVQMGYIPRMNIIHTSDEEIGQIYCPLINWMLLAASVFLVVFFESSANLAAAYGIAVSLTMCITTGLMFYICRHRWGWTLASAAGAVGVLLTIDLAFLYANLFKILDGGWFPIAVAAAILTAMRVWRKGRLTVSRRMRQKTMTLKQFLEHLDTAAYARVPGTAIYMASDVGVIPPALIHNLRHNKALHEDVILLTVETEEVPVVPAEDRVKLRRVRKDIWQMVAAYGFMEDPNISKLITDRAGVLEIDASDLTYVLGQETIIPKAGKMFWRGKIFAYLSRNAQRATRYFNLPPDDVVEIGMQIKY